MNNQFRYRVIAVPDPTHQHIYHSLILDSSESVLYLPLHTPLISGEDYNSEIWVDKWIPTAFVYNHKTYYHKIHNYTLDYIIWQDKKYIITTPNIVDNSSNSEIFFKRGEKQIEVLNLPQNTTTQLIVKDEEDIYEIIEGNEEDKWKFNYLYKYQGKYVVPQVIYPDKIEVYPTLLLYNLQITDNHKVNGWNTQKPIIIIKKQGYDNSKFKEKINSSNNSIIMPVFFRVRDLGNLEVHNEVTENVSINLDTYKNKVKYFILRIGDYSSQEIGRNNTGVIFQIIGPKIGNKSSGLYYILNENGEVVTTGNYFTKN